LKMFSSSKKTSPDVGFIRFNISLATVVFPHPLSPTRPKVSFLLISKLTLSTACTRPTCFLSKTPLEYTGKYLTKLLTLMRSWSVSDVFPPSRLYFAIHGMQRNARILSPPRQEYLLCKSVWHNCNVDGNDSLKEAR